MDKSSNIRKFEIITYEKSFQITEYLLEYKLVYDILNYIIDVEHINKENEKYDKLPNFIGINEKTPYKNIKSVIDSLFI